MISIGPVRLKNPFVCAAMEEHSDRPFRLMMTEFGAALVITEMVQADRLVKGDRLAARQLAYSPAERPIAGQLLGGELEDTAAAARIVDLVDLDLSCPIRRVIARGWGGVYLQKPERVEALFRAVTREVRIPATLKFRSGWDESSINAPEVARAAQEGGAAAVILHGRSVVQAYKGEADWSIIGETKRAVSIPVGGAGSVRTPEDAVRMLRETGCDMVLMARGCLGNPWIFSRALALLREQRLPPPFPRLRDLLHAARSQAEFFQALKDFFRGAG
jgi:tRNA-dihydrouridine synthase B